MTTPIPGSPDEILAAADGFDAAATRWRAVHDSVLAHASTLDGAWTGSVAATFAGARVRHDAEVAGRTGDACRAAVAPLRTFAEELRRAQQDWADGAGMSAADPTSATDGADVMASATDRARAANEDAARAVHAAAAGLATLVPPQTAPQVVGDSGTFGDGLWQAGRDVVGGIGAMLGGAADRLDPFGDRFGAAWASTGRMISSTVSNPLAAVESMIEATIAPVGESYRHGGADEAAGRAVGIAAALAGDKGLSRLEKLGELGTASKLGDLADPNPGWHSSVERGPHTPLAPGGGLQRHEDAGGHTLRVDKAHVGASADDLMARLANDPTAKRVSSFFDRPTAEKSVRENITGNADNIKRWLDTPSLVPKGFDWSHTYYTGISAAGGPSPSIASVSRSRIVLKQDPTSTDGYFVYTSYPQP